MTFHIDTPSRWIGPLDFSRVIDETVALGISDDGIHTQENGTVVGFDFGFSLVYAWRPGCRVSLPIFLQFLFESLWNTTKRR